MYYSIIASSSSLSTVIEKHHPEFESLDRLCNQWSIFGTLTYRNDPPSPTTQVKDCIQLFTTLGNLNHSHTDLLQWVVRVEYSEGSRFHLHFILGGDRIVNGHHHPMSVADACKVLCDNWTHGSSEVVPYDPSEDGVGYITKGRKSKRIGLFVFSPTLKKILKKLPHATWRDEECQALDRYVAKGLDPHGLEIELITKLKRKGVPVCFYDERKSK
jgi:hypothetical protein